MLELVLRCGMDTLIASNIMCVPASTNMTNLTLGKAACVPGRLLGRPKTLAFSSLEIPLRKMKRLCLACLLEPIAYLYVWSLPHFLGTVPCLEHQNKCHQSPQFAIDLEMLLSSHQSPLVVLTGETIASLPLPLIVAELE